MASYLVPTILVPLLLAIMVVVYTLYRLSP
jgi:hypothetical protein